MIGNLQVLRFFAASGVVVLHSNTEILGQHTDFYGVAVFFVLSGYVMSMVTRKSAGRFFTDRVWRIVPAYWLATALVLFGLGAWRHTSLQHLVMSLFFIPHYEPDAGFFPILGVGWTLNLEMYFYLLFTLAIVLAQLVRRDIAPALAGAMVVALALILPHVTSNDAVLFYYTHEYMYFFVIGIGIWYLMNWLSPHLGRVTMPRWAFPLAFPIFVALVLLGINQFVIVTALFLIAILASKMRADIQVRTLLLLGAASYACYLLHTILLAALRARGIEISGTAVFTLLVLVVAWAISVVWYETIERFIRKAQRRWNTRHSLSTTPGAS